MMCKRKAFTLVEVIVVIAIIAITAAFLFPSFVTARKQAHVAICAGNLKQIYGSLAMYGADNDDWVPPISTSDSPTSASKGSEGWYFSGDPARWKTLLRKYGPVDDQYWCPLDPHRPEKFLGFMEPAHSLRWRHTSFMINPTFSPNFFGSAEGIFRLNLSSLPSGWRLRPSETIYISDAIWGDTTAPAGVNRLTGNHGQGRKVNALYLDGHVKHDVVEKL